MATSGSTSTGMSVSEGFYYETKYIVLSYLQLPPARSHDLLSAQGDSHMERQRTDNIKEQIEEELKKLEDEIAVSSSSSGFDRRTSLVFNPTNPESSVEDCLASLGDQVVIDLDTHLVTAVDTLLKGALDYEIFRETIFDLSVHTQGGWNKVLVPLVLLQALQAKGQSVSSLLSLGVDFLKENEAEYIIQQGGWGKVFGLVSEEEPGVTIAEDSNDIYILSGEQHPDQLSPPSSLLCSEGNSHSTWQTESLPVSLAAHESWAHVAAMDPEDVKSLDSNEGVALAEERSENNSSNSDIVHVEREEAELLEETGEGVAIEESLMSVLGTESDLAALRDEYREQTPPIPLSSEAESATPSSLMSLEEPVVIDTPASLSTEPSIISLEAELTEMAQEAAAPPYDLQSVPALEPQFESEPTPVPVEEPIAAVKEPLIESIPTSEEVKISSEMAVEVQPAIVPPLPDESQSLAEQATKELVLETAAPPVAAPAQDIPVQPPVEPEPTSDFPVLLYGGAALALITAIMAYGVISYRRK